MSAPKTTLGTLRTKPHQVAQETLARYPVTAWVQKRHDLLVSFVFVIAIGLMASFVTAVITHRSQAGALVVSLMVAAVVLLAVAVLPSVLPGVKVAEKAAEKEKVSLQKSIVSETMFRYSVTGLKHNLISFTVGKGKSVRVQKDGRNLLVQPVFTDSESPLTLEYNGKDLSKMPKTPPQTRSKTSQTSNRWRGSAHS